MHTATEIEDERKRNNPPTFNGFTYSGETSDEDDPNKGYYYAGKFASHRVTFFPLFMATNTNL